MCCPISLKRKVGGERADNKEMRGEKHKSMKFSGLLQEHYTFRIRFIKFTGQR